MKEIIYNDDKLNDFDINEIVVRTKALIINNNDILIANENDVLQFPGGHLEENEKLEDCLKREIKEETGIIIDDNEIGNCILKVIYMNKNWPNEGINRKSEIYYYVINTNKQPDINNINLTENEKKQNYKVYYIKLDDSINYINEYMNKNTLNKVICPDMISVIKEYLNFNN